MVALDIFTSETSSLAFTLGLFAGMLILLELGRHLGAGYRQGNGGGGATGTSAVEGAVFALLGLLIAFTFSGAAGRFDMRRHLIVEEANAIGTAYLRLDLLAPAAQPALRDGFRRYLDGRFAAYAKIPDLPAVKDELDRVAAIQGEIWSGALAATRDLPQAAMLLLPALNAMFDIATSRTAAAQMHPPTIVFVMLGGLTLTCALLAGIGMGAAPKRSWLHMIGFAAIMAISIYVILDIEHPRIGMFRVNDTDQLLRDVRASMK